MLAKKSLQEFLQLIKPPTVDLEMAKKYFEIGYSAGYKEAYDTVKEKETCKQLFFKF